ncbi:hypothetical protein Bra3105_17865 [Brachybacterium halotolerans subsp. kimchii]|uniref:hypothetical protein n=1 Tax=Brachybacterium halotolerans TaxID=2795215 RepID=UPI001E4CF284|nr:hypothetical protein [Brachybacterium halotolerans]UEJ82669.1 hypothetical protein Bra3105_17865 [Brachybacterium halotolerans subsp. kimchii]
MSTNLTDFPLKSKIVASGEVDGITWVAASAPIYDAVNGYVRLPEAHPWLAARDLSDIDTSVPWGEITYGRGNWIGFDTLHAGQYWPGQPYGPSEGALHMTPETVISWVERLAREAAEVIA